MSGTQIKVVRYGTSELLKNYKAPKSIQILWFVQKDKNENKLAINKITNYFFNNKLFNTHIQ